MTAEEARESAKSARLRGNEDTAHEWDVWAEELEAAEAAEKQSKEKR